VTCGIRYEEGRTQDEDHENVLLIDCPFLTRVLGISTVSSLGRGVDQIRIDLMVPTGYILIGVGRQYDDRFRGEGISGSLGSARPECYRLSGSRARIPLWQQCVGGRGTRNPKDG
jgi:hypothetical protein